MQIQLAVYCILVPARSQTVNIQHFSERNCVKIMAVNADLFYQIRGLAGIHNFVN